MRILLLPLLQLVLLYFCLLYFYLKITYYVYTVICFNFLFWIFLPRNYISLWNVIFNCYRDPNFLLFAVVKTLSGNSHWILSNSTKLWSKSKILPQYRFKQRRIGTVKFFRLTWNNCHHRIIIHCSMCLIFTIQIVNYPC